MVNAFEVLNISQQATQEEIREAYRKLARRWHPDRFQQGPERDWANEKMAEINAAYHACRTARQTLLEQTDAQQAQLEDVEKLIEAGEYRTARHRLMEMTTRCAQWNYLFGLALLRLEEVEKAVTYLTVASHQKPDCARYREALRQAEASPKRMARIWRGF